MLQPDRFIPLIRAAIPRFQARRPNANQEGCVLHDPTIPLMIVAGPGTGKTTVLVLRALRLVFVDGFMPEQVLLTTFTRKAATEIRARLIEWGLTLRSYLQRHPPANPPRGFDDWLESIDINRFVTGTLDSICEEVLTTHRDPADPAPVLVEGFVGNALLMFQGLFPIAAHNDSALDAYLTNFTFDGEAPRNFAAKLDVCRSIIDRLIHDQVDLQAFTTCPTHTQARQSIVTAADAYRRFMADTNQMDFARLEELFLERLSQRRLGRFTSGIRAVLVDEYQDTNPLQESIYFELIRQTNASLSIVGDDDQSLYRFRGATVELFRDFVHRFRALVPGIQPPHLNYLVDNYRSTPEIVSFFNSFAHNDPAFAPARVQPPKPLINAQVASTAIPVLGMFRPDTGTLSEDLTHFLLDVFRGAGRQFQIGANRVQIIRNPQGGDFGDCVFLSHTVDEYASRFGNNAPRERLPLLVRRRLHARGVGVFNPRGRLLRDIPVVQQLLGILLDCIDPPNANAPDGGQQTAVIGHLRNESRIYLSAWRREARAFMATNPHPTRPQGLRDFVVAWQRRTSQVGADWPNEWPLLELCFKIISWIPVLRDDPEGQVYLEAITRCISQAATFSPFRSSIIFGRHPNVNSNLHFASVRRAIMDIIVPIAEKQVDVDEEILPSVPRSMLPIMTIHQAKGLEYPLVIVDVSSDYNTNHRLNRFRRFPEAPSAVQNLEDDLAPYCPIGPLRLARQPLARTFDDLIRLYYVAFSRPQSLLLLVGLDKCLQYRTTIRHIATGWRSDGTWAWARPVAGRPPPLANNIPLQLI